MGTRQLPDFIFAIDFGTTFTGAGYTKVGGQTQTIRNWPGGGDSNERKVSTALVYPYNGRTPSSWGFLCALDDDVDKHRPKWFKTYLDQETLDRARRYQLSFIPRSIVEARQYATDYLREIYIHIREFMQTRQLGWLQARIEFIFSIPTTWTAQEILESFKSIISNAGFGTESEAHSIALELTEAEAAAVYTIKSSQVPFQRGDIFLSCDAGGGTTDLALTRVITSGTEGIPTLKQIDAVNGLGIGSTILDRAFEALVQRRLATYTAGMGGLPVEIPHDLPASMAASSQWIRVKHNIGTRESRMLSQLSVRIDELPRYSNTELGIDRGRMNFSRDELEGLFNAQIDRIAARIWQQLDWMKSHNGSEQVEVCVGGCASNLEVIKYLILSGGLGSSPYVRERLEEVLKRSPHPNAWNMTIIVSDDPQLAVVKGLLEDRRQQYDTGSNCLTTRIARASYGVICKYPYNPLLHIGEEVEDDKCKDGVKWALNQIDWLVKKGDELDTNNSYIESVFQRKVLPGDPNREWDANIVISHNSRENLPQSMKREGAIRLCTVKSSLAGVNELEFQAKNRRCWQGRKYYLATFTIRVVVAPADLKFELWFKGVKYSRNHDPIKVQWDRRGAEAAAPRSPTLLRDEWEAAL